MSHDVATPEREYVLGTHDAELVRLGFQHRVWSAQAFACWERAGFGPRQTLLDVGCGPGYAALDLAQLVGPGGRVIAVDVSARFIDYFKTQLTSAGATNIEARLVDVEHLDLPAASIDGAYARSVLCFVADPEAVIAGVARALKPGAVFAVQDYHNYHALTLAPRSPIFDRVVEAVDASWRQRGGDPDIAGRLPAIMARHGLAVREITPITRVARPGSALWNWPATFFVNYVPILVEMGLLSADDQRVFESEWSARSKDPHTFLVTPPMYDIIAVKA